MEPPAHEWGFQVRLLWAIKVCSLPMALPLSTFPTMGMRSLPFHSCSDSSAYSYPILKTVIFSLKVQHRKNLKKEKNPPAYEWDTKLLLTDGDRDTGPDRQQSIQEEL